MSRVLLISGSLRRDSFNSRLLQHITASIHGSAQVDCLDPREVALPLFDQDLELDPGSLQRASRVYSRIAQADGLIIASPEYNGQLTPYLKNLVDWVSRLPGLGSEFEPIFCDRPVLLCSASTGSSGGAVGMAHARALFGYVGAIVIGDTVCVANAQGSWDDGLGFLFQPEMQRRIDEAAQRLLSQARHFQASRRHATPNTELTA